jgi:hypothetical protein
MIASGPEGLLRFEAGVSKSPALALARLVSLGAGVAGTVVVVSVAEV